MKSEFQFLCLLYASLYPDDPFEKAIKFAEYWVEMVDLDYCLSEIYEDWATRKDNI